MQTALGIPHGTGIAAPQPAVPLMRKAMELEAVFLAEMLGHGGLADSVGPYSGGYGEEQFSSFLRMEQAQLMVKRGGIGLAERIFRALSEASDGG